MEYTIGQVSKITGLTSYTLRYYDKEGLLPFIKKKLSGIRCFSDEDLDWLTIIECLKSTGLEIKKIKQYINWFVKGESTLQKRLELFLAQKKAVQNHMKKLQDNMEKIDFKIKYYKEAMKHGSKNVFENNKKLRQEKDRIFAKLQKT